MGPNETVILGPLLVDIARSDWVSRSTGYSSGLNLSTVDYLHTPLTIISSSLSRTLKEWSTRWSKHGDTDQPSSV